MFVILGEVGEYSDRKVWAVAVVDGDRMAAQALCDTASALSRALWKHRKEQLDEVGYDYDNPVFRVIDDRDDATILGPDDNADASMRWRTDLDAFCDPTKWSPTTYFLEEVPVHKR